MDIYNFIENEEQREYLLNKHYEFTAVEAAYVVCNSNRAIKEKHDAIDYIINNYEDCEMVKECQTEYSSTLDYLKEYNKIRIFSSGLVYRVCTRRMDWWT